jgi:hypothetical protein
LEHGQVCAGKMRILQLSIGRSENSIQHIASEYNEDKTDQVENSPDLKQQLIFFVISLKTGLLLEVFELWRFQAKCDHEKYDARIKKDTYKDNNK